jgi:hypothetical protein
MTGSLDTYPYPTVPLITTNTTDLLEIMHPEPSGVKQCRPGGLQTRIRPPPLPRARSIRADHGGSVSTRPGWVWETRSVFVTNHVLSGALIGQLMKRRPVEAFLVGVGSHLLLDAVPHWGCDLDEPARSERFLKVARTDGTLGLVTMAVAAAMVGEKARTATVAAMAGAVFLDLDKPMDHFFGRNPFPRPIVWLHGMVQRESADGMPREFAYASAFAIADTILASLARRQQLDAEVTRRQRSD